MHACDDYNQRVQVASKSFTVFSGPPPGCACDNIAMRMSVCVQLLAWVARLVEKRSMVRQGVCGWFAFMFP